MSRHIRSNFLSHHGFLFGAIVGAIVLVLASLPWSAALAAAPVVTVSCNWPSSAEAHEFGVDIDFDQRVFGFEDPLDVELEFTHGAGVLPTYVGSVSLGPDNGSSHINLGGLFYTSTYEPVTDEVAASLKMPAGAVVNGLGEENTASNTLHISVNRTVSVGDAVATEGTDSNIEFAVTLGSRNDCLTVTVDWETVDGTATAGDDYTASSGTLTFGPSETTKTVSISVLDDSASENGETLTLKLSNASGATISDDAATGTVSDDDSNLKVSIAAKANLSAEQQSQRSVEAVSDSVTEGSAAVFTLTRTGDVAAALTVGVSVSETGVMLSGTAPSSVTFSAGSTTAVLTVATEDDEVAESASVVTATVAAGSGYTVDAGANSATVTVEDDDAAPVITSAGPFTTDENETAVTTLTATDDDTAVSDLAWSVAGGADSDKFTLNAGGELAFKAAKDFEAPDDADQDGEYEVTVRVTDGANPVDAALTVRLEDVDEIAPNSAPTGLPTISGTAQVGETLTASSTGISDADGLTDATFAWQWIANDGTSDADIAGATSTSYTLTATEVGKTIRVRATFTDDGGTEETLLSGPTAAVKAALTARFESIPTSHDGSTKFTLDLQFSEQIPLSFRSLRDAALVASGGTVRRARRLQKGSNIGWRITVEPGADGDVVISLPARQCGVNGAICTSDSQPLSQGISATVPGPSSLAREVSISASSSPTSGNVTPASDTVTEGTAAVFTLTRTGSLASALTVNVDVSETGTTLKGTPAATVTFGSNSATAELSVETEDDEVAESASAITAALAAGSDYSMDSGASSATVTVEDDDAAPVATTASPIVTPENGVSIATLTATDDDTPVADLAWSVAGGADQNKVTLSTSGVLAFQAAKDFEAPDDADQDGDYEVTVRVTDGANPVDTALTIRLTDVDEVVPALSTASVDGAALTLTFSEVLDGSASPASSAFSVTVSGTAREVSNVAMSASTVTLTLASAVVAGETVTVGYTVPTGANASPIEDAAGNAVAAFSGQAVTNATPASNAAPTGLPTISGTAQVGETLTASADGIADDDGLTNATFAWQWLANDGTADADIAGATGTTYTLTSAEEGRTIKVRVTFTDDGGAGETLLSAATAAVEAANSEPTGLPVISGTAQVGETLTASASQITDADGLADATFAWQWIANDGTADADIAGATGSGYALTSAEAGKTIKVRATFTDDRGTEETLVGAATAVVAAALPAVSVAADSSPVTEGTAASFTLTRTGDTAAALTVAVSVAESGAVLSGTPASTVTFAADSAEATLVVATDDDGVAEADARVTVSLATGSGYGVNADAGSAEVDVYDNDEAAPTPAVETLWTSTLTVQDIGGALLGYAYGNGLSPNGWSEDGAQFSVRQLYYFAQYEELAFTLSAAPSDPEQLTLHLDDLPVQLSGASGLKNFFWTAGHPGWQAGQTVAVKLTRTDPDAVVDAGPGLSVADAQVQEAEGAALSFRVTLEEAQGSAVSVRYATADGTATAGADYEAVSGALRFEAGETAKTVSVAVLNDAHDEGSETLTLALSAPFGAEVADGTATGTIVNTGPMPQAWIARFGRTVGLQAIEAIGDRLSGGSGGTQVVVGGEELVGSGALAGTLLNEDADWPMGPEDADWSPDAHNGRSMTGRELLLGSSFNFGAGGEDGGPAWTAWGRVATSSFEGREDDLSLSGDVTTGFLGADMAQERWLAGLAVGLSEGEGSFDDGAGDGGGTVESSLTSVFPYARLGVSDGVDLWGLVGIGNGDLTLTVGEEMTRTDLSMQMGALGLRSELVAAEEAGAFGLALKTDAMWVRTESSSARSSTGGNLEAAGGDVSRVRVALEGSQAFAAGAGSTFTPTVELGLRQDGGDAETGTGVEAGFGLQYVNPAQGLTVEGRVRGLLTHADSGYEEWGASGSVRLDPGVSGRGVSLSIAPVWGATSGGVEQLWSEGTAAGLAADDAFEAGAGLQAEFGYGFGLAGNAGVLTPYAGLSLGEGGSREYRTGTRWRVGPQSSLALDASHKETSVGDAPTNALMLRAAVRF